MGKTSIEWTDLSVNPIRARHKVTGKVGWHCVAPSPGCANCYSRVLNGRFGTGLPYNKRAEDEIELFLDMKSMEALRKRRKPAKVFLCDMTDLFGEFVPFAWIDDIMATIVVSQQHTFQVLTKRPARMAEYFGTGGRYVPSNVWAGTSVEDQRRADERIPALLEIPATVRFLSMEPLLGPVAMRSAWIDRRWHANEQPACGYDASSRCDHIESCFAKGRCDGDFIGWVIVGGESGHGARPCNLVWIRSIRDQCRAAEVPLFVKQLGSRPYEHTGNCCDKHTAINLRDPKGGDPSEWPMDLREGCRQFPVAVKASA